MKPSTNISLPYPKNWLYLQGPVQNENVELLVQKVRKNVIKGTKI